MDKEWSVVIKPKTGWFDLKLKEIWQYRDLIVMFLKRNFNSAYKQTILGPLWFLITPLLSSSMHTPVFDTTANIPTDGVPHFLFCLCSNTAWAYFSACLTSTSSTFTGNAGLFGKVYFPRLITPITNVIYSLLSFVIQLVLLAVAMLIFGLRGTVIVPDVSIFIMPVLLLQMALLGLSVGLIISSITTKYRDLSILVGFGIHLWMYVTPVVYPISQAASISESISKIVMLNPVAPIVNNFRYIVLGCGSFDCFYWGISWIVTFVVLFIGILIFNRVEKTFMDTV